ncbi:MAG: glycerol-3-phosphate acyltransferase [Chloroflexi bacterium]|nr:glycerol-3-phosphate acyltransferase [Chloroflexota bacterium]
MGNNVWLILIAVSAYIIGSIPTAYFVVGRMIGTDIRQSGSHNIGAMNTFRLIQENRSTKAGMAGFFLVLVGDVGKGALAVFLAQWLSFLDYEPGLATIIAGFFAVAGHNYSIFMRFQGGRGLATIGGVVMALNPAWFFLSVAILLITIFAFQYLVVGKMNWGSFSEIFSVVGSQLIGRVAGLIFVVIAIYFFNPGIFLPTLAGMVLVYVRHVDRVKAYIIELRTARKK